MHELLKRLKVMDIKQLKELWHDINDVETIERIYDSTTEYLNDYYLDGGKVTAAEADQPLINEVNKEEREADLAQRYRDYISDKQHG